MADNSSNRIQLDPQESAQRWPNFIVALSKCLRMNNIPNLMFKDYALALHGITSGFSGASFVIPDSSVDEASEALVEAGLELDSVPDVKFIRPALQLSIPENQQQPWSKIEFCFYKQSQVMWELQPLRTLPNYSTEDILYISSSARWEKQPSDESKDDSLCIPSIARLLRAYIQLAIRAEVEFSEEVEANHWLGRYTNAANVLEAKGLWNADVEKAIRGEDDELGAMLDWVHGKLNGKEAWDETVARVTTFEPYVSWTRRTMASS